MSGHARTTARMLTLVLIASVVVAVTAGAAVALAPTSTTTAPLGSPAPSGSLPPTCAPTPSASASPGTADTTRHTSPATAAVTPTASPLVTLSLGMVAGHCALIDSSGRSLYVYLNDTTPHTSTCAGSCAQAWPPLTGPAGAGNGLAAADLGIGTRTDGTVQASFHTRPLYYFTGDSNPADANGQGIASAWYLVGPDGKPIQQ